MALCEAYTEETENKRIVLKLNPALDPYKVAVFPLVRNKEQLVKKAKEVLDMVSPHFSATWDDRGNIGKRYYAQDEIGTPFCVTVDYDTVEKGIVTVRSRDTMQQQSIPVTNLVEYIEKSIQVI
jgi:glycyl-tRNA synthetase